MTYIFDQDDPAADDVTLEDATRDEAPVKELPAQDLPALDWAELVSTIPELEPAPEDAALSLADQCRLGGVGYYPESDFVHVDCGPVRTW